MGYAAMLYVFTCHAVGVLVRNWNARPVTNIHWSLIFHWNRKNWIYWSIWSMFHVWMPNTARQFYMDTNMDWLLPILSPNHQQQIGSIKASNRQQNYYCSNKIHYLEEFLTWACPWRQCWWAWPSTAAPGCPSRSSQKPRRRCTGKIFGLLENISIKKFHENILYVSSRSLPDIQVFVGPGRLFWVP